MELRSPSETLPVLRGIRDSGSISVDHASTIQLPVHGDLTLTIRRHYQKMSAAHSMMSVGVSGRVRSTITDSGQMAAG